MGYFYMIKKDNEIYINISVSTTGFKYDNEIINFAMFDGEMVRYFERSDLDISKLFFTNDDNLYESLACRKCLLYDEVDIIDDKKSIPIRTIKDTDDNLKEKFKEIILEIYENNDRKKINLVFFNNIENFFLINLVNDFLKGTPIIYDIINPYTIDLYTIYKILSEPGSDSEKIINEIQSYISGDVINDVILLNNYMEILFENIFK